MQLSLLNHANKFGDLLAQEADDGGKRNVV